MSFALTTEQIKNHTKTVTRRLGWANLKPGERFLAVEKCMGLKKGEKHKVLAELECVSNRPECIGDMNAVPFSYGENETKLEGFPEMTGAEFVEMFSRKMKINPVVGWVNRIEFKYVGAERDRDREFAEAFNIWARTR